MVIAHKLCSNDTLPLFTVMVHPLPTPTIIQNNTTLSSGSYSSYQWFYEGNPLSGATAQSHIAIANGNYHVIVTDLNGCSNSSDTVLVGNVSVIGVNNGFISVEIFPNPNDGAFTINGEIENSGDITVSITDMLGRAIKTQMVHVKEKHFSESIKMNFLPASQYFLKIISSKQSFTLPFTIK